MFPWAHAAFGYALFASTAFLRRRRISRTELLAVVIGTQLPDLVDKPLAWWFNALPSGRSLAHSLVVAVPLSIGVLLFAWYRTHPETGLAFATGYMSHLFGDSYGALYHWRPTEFSFLLWPLLPAYPDDSGGFLELFGAVELTRGVLFPLVVAAAVGVFFLVHFHLAPWVRPE